MGTPASAGNAALTEAFSGAITPTNVKGKPVLSHLNLA